MDVRQLILHDPERESGLREEITIFSSGDDGFGSDIDYATLQKIYGTDPENETRYSPAKCLGCEVKEIAGNPDPKHGQVFRLE